jgi:hypothetical protein
MPILFTHAPVTPPAPVSFSLSNHSHVLIDMDRDLRSACP